MEYKTVFIVDPVKSERLQLAKFIMQENFTIMGFVDLKDCFKSSNPMTADLVVFVMRKDKAEINSFLKTAKRRQTPYILLLSSELPEVSLGAMEEQGFKSMYFASNNEKVREIVYGLLAPDGLLPRSEVPHPVPLT